VKVNMSSTILKNKYDEVFHIRCDCGHFGIVEIGKFRDEDEPFYFTITAPHETLKEKIKGIWRIIRGSDYGITDSILFTKKDAKKMIKWLEKQFKS